ncbi:MAG: hypothetical protein ACOC32_03320 [Nanoarchaeota archaeon]
MFRFFAKKKKKKGKKAKRIAYLEQELKRRDGRIQELNEKNTLLLKTTMRQSREIIDLKETLQRFHEASRRKQSRHDES